MGCDFQIIGCQPDEQIQINCIRFLIDLLNEKNCEYTIIDSGLSVPVGTSINRKKSLIFSPPDHMSDICENYTIPGIYNKNKLYGIIIHNKFGYPFQFVFDRAMGGTLCSVELTGNICGGVYAAYADYHKGHDREYIPRLNSDLYLWLGSSTRIKTGTAYLYVLSFVISKLFISNLFVDADYDIEIFNNYLIKINCVDKLLNATESELPKITHEIIDLAQINYDLNFSR